MAWMTWTLFQTLINPYKTLKKHTSSIYISLNEIFYISDLCVAVGPIVLYILIIASTNKTYLLYDEYTTLIYRYVSRYVSHLQ